MSVRQTRRVIPKTLDYIINPAIPDSPGTLFTNRGATGAIVFTLPAPSPALQGWFYDFLAIANFGLSVKTAAPDTFVLLNDVAAKQLGLVTGGQIIGGSFRVICDGTQWVGFGTSVGTTFTVTA